MTQEEQDFRDFLSGFGRLLEVRGNAADRDALKRLQATLEVLQTAVESRLEALEGSVYATPDVWLSDSRRQVEMAGRAYLELGPRDGSGGRYDFSHCGGFKLGDPVRRVGIGRLEGRVMEVGIDAMHLVTFPGGRQYWIDHGSLRHRAEDEPLLLTMVERFPSETSR